MKKLLFILSLLAGLIATAQPSNYTRIAARYRWIAGLFDSTLHVPAGATPLLRVGGYTGAGAVFVDTSGTGQGFYYYKDGIFNRLAEASDIANINTLYSADDTLASDRTVEGNQRFLGFINMSLFLAQVKNNPFTIASSILQQPSSINHNVTSATTGHTAAIVIDSANGVFKASVLATRSTSGSHIIEAFADSIIFRRTNTANLVMKSYGLPVSASTSDSVLVKDVNNQWKVRAQGDISAGGSFWSLTGNAGTTPGTNFLGTTDGQGLVIKTNSATRLAFDNGPLMRSEDAFWFTSPSTDHRAIFFRHNDTTQYYIRDNSANSRIDMIAPSINISALTGALTLVQAGNTNFFMSNGGNIAIGGGNFSPAFKLEVMGESSYESNLRLKEIAAPSTPASGYAKIYVKTDGLFYGKDDAGTETKLSNTTGGIDDVLAVAQALTANRQIDAASFKLTLVGSNTTRLFEADLTSDGIPMFIAKTGTNTTTTSEIHNTTIRTSGTSANGFGGEFNTYIETSDGAAGNLATKIIHRLSDVTAGTLTSEIAFQTRNNAGTATDRLIIKGNGTITLTGRFQPQQGADIASVAGAIAVGFDGSSFELTGTNAVTLISNVGWSNGAEITLIFTSTASLTDGTANSGTDIGMELAGNINFSGNAGSTLTLLLSEIGGTQRWREKCRSIN